MKKLFYALLITSTIGFTACNTTKDTAQAPSNEQPAEKSEVAETPSSDERAADMAPQSTNNQNNAELTGSEIVERMAKTLQTKLALNETQTTSISGSISEAFVSAGNSLEEKYSVEKAKEFTKPTLKAAQSGISNVLDENQIVKFNQFLNK